MSDSKKTQEKIKELINDVRFTMMATMSADGQHRSRPMTTQTIEDFAEGIWFLGDNTSDAIADIKANANVCLAYAATDNGNYVSITGKAELIEDRAKLESLWSPAFEAFYTDINDPKLQLIRVTPHQGAYWIGAGSVETFYKMVKAAITGEKSDSLGEYGEIDFS